MLFGWLWMTRDQKPCNDATIGQGLSLLSRPVTQSLSPSYLRLINIVLSTMLELGGFQNVGAPMRGETAGKAVVHVVEDDAFMRDALANLFDTVGLATQMYATAHDFLTGNLTDRPGCIIIDVRLPDMNGLDFQTRIAQMGIRLPVVMMTGYGDIPMSVRAMKRGAVDFLAKPFHDQDMLDAVMAAIERDRERRTVDNDVAHTRQRFSTLSAREQQVMLMVTAGKMNKQVAGDLGLAEITVKNHRGAAMRKMAARTLADLVRMAELIRPTRP